MLGPLSDLSVGCSMRIVACTSQQNHQLGQAMRPLHRNSSCDHQCAAQSPAIGSRCLLGWIACGFPGREMLNVRITEYKNPER